MLSMCDVRFKADVGGPCRKAYSVGFTQPPFPSQHLL